MWNKTFHLGEFCLGKLYGSGAQQQGLNHKLENGYNHYLKQMLKPCVLGEVVQGEEQGQGAET